MEANYATASGGWQGVRDVGQVPPQGDDKQQSFLLAAGLHSHPGVTLVTWTTIPAVIN
jgi:hypothetical protein